MPGGCELERAGEARLARSHVERERALAGESQVADRVRLKLLRLLCVGGGADELERGQIVVGEHVGQVLRPLACLALDPGGGRAVAGGSGGARDLRVADVPDQQVPEAVLALAFHRARTQRADELLAGELVQRELDLARLARRPSPPRHPPRRACP